jgi:hypothetical protein
MQRFLRVVVLVLTAAPACSSQILSFVPCKIGSVSKVGRADGISFQRVSIIEPYGEVGASVFIPDSESPIPGIVFSHATIHGPVNSADLAHFALALARAGAASIVLDGTIEWQTPNDNSKRPAHVMACAGQWLLLNASLDSKRLAIGGTTNWGGGDTPLCLPGERPCWTPIAVMGYGQASPAEWSNTDALLTLKGQLRIASFARQQLRLAELKPEWFMLDQAN